jgi:hypothetical protein
MASDPIRIEIRGLVHERDDAQHDLQRTIEALQEKLVPQRAARRFVARHDPVLVVAGLVAAGLAFGLVGDERFAGRATGLVAAVAAGAILFGLARD